MKAIPADRTAQFDLTESSHKTSSRYMKSWKEISVPVFSRESGYIALVLMVGVGAANAGELVVNGRGVAFVCLEHFTSITNPETHGLGLDPELIPLWLAHEIAHAVRYTSPESRSDMRQVIADMEGYYSYWETGKRVNLRELLVNEGISVQVSRVI